MTLAQLESTITGLIEKQETSGGSAGVGASLNNPGALKYAPWETTLYSASPTASGFASFPTFHQGDAAATYLVNQNVQSGKSITQLINSWSPASDGNTNNAQRINEIASATQLDPNQSILSQVQNPNQAPAGSDSQLPTTTNPGGGYATGNIPGTPSPEDQGSHAITDTTGSWFDLGRIATLLVGLIAVVIGLTMFKQTQVIIQNAAKTGAKAGELFA